MSTSWLLLFWFRDLDEKRRSSPTRKRAGGEFQAFSILWEKKEAWGTNHGRFLAMFKSWPHRLWRGLGSKNNSGSMIHAPLMMWNVALILSRCRRRSEEISLRRAKLSSWGTLLNPVTTQAAILCTPSSFLASFADRVTMPENNIQGEAWHTP